MSNIAPNRRNLVDATLQTTKVLPAAAANNDHSGIDLGHANRKPENLMVRIDVPATDTLVENKKLTFHLEDSADNSTFADINPLVQDDSIAGVSGDTSAAASVYLPIPPNCRRYIRVNQAVETGGGDVTDTTVTVSVVA